MSLARQQLALQAQVQEVGKVLRRLHGKIEALECVFKTEMQDGNAEIRNQSAHDPEQDQFDSSPKCVRAPP